LDELSTNAHVLSSSLVQSDSLDYQVRNFYPFPLAYSYRTLSGIHDPFQKYPEQLRVAENLLAFLANIGLSLGQEGNMLLTEGNTNITATSFSKYFGGGISPGDWLSIAHSVANLLREKQRQTMSEKYSSLWFKGTGSKESDFTKTTKRLVELKNDFKHDRGPKTPHDFDKASEEIQDLIDYCYEQLSFFVRYPIRLVQSLDVDLITSDAILETLVYAGDHPGLRLEKVNYPKALPKGLLYLELSKDNWIRLYPHINVQYCPSCKTRETYFVDRWDGIGNKVVLKSFERGHTHESDEDAKKIASDLANWIKENLKG